MARDFAGANGNYLSVGDVPAIDITGTALTVACWARPDSVNSNFHAVLGKDAGSASSVQYTLYLHNGNVWAFQIGDATSIDAVLGATSPTAGVWVHLVGRKNGIGAGALQLFLNGVSDGSATSNRTIQDTANALLIGNRSANDIFFDGAVAEVGIWNAALTDAEVMSLAKGFAPSVVRPQNLRGYWPLLGNANPEPDLRNGHGASLTGTAPKADHPRILRPRPAIYLP